jgi:hypothetical protein
MEFVRTWEISFGRLICGHVERLRWSYLGHSGESFVERLHALLGTDLVYGVQRTLVHVQSSRAAAARTSLHLRTHPETGARLKSHTCTKNIFFFKTRFHPKKKNLTMSLDLTVIMGYMQASASMPASPPANICFRSSLP